MLLPSNRGREGKEEVGWAGTEGRRLGGSGKQC
jgi:hypothetical protein